MKYCAGQRVQSGFEIKKMFIQCKKNAFSSNLKIDRLADFTLNTNSSVSHFFYLFLFFFFFFW